MIKLSSMLYRIFASTKEAITVGAAQLAIYNAYHQSNSNLRVHRTSHSSSSRDRFFSEDKKLPDNKNNNQTQNLNRKLK